MRIIVKNNYLENLKKLNEIFTSDNILLCQDGPFLTVGNMEKQQYSPIGAAIEIIYPNLRSNLKEKVDMDFNLDTIVYAPAVALRGYLEIYHHPFKDNINSFRLMILNTWNKYKGAYNRRSIKIHPFFYLLGMFGIHDQYGSEVQFSDLKQKLEDCIKFVEENEYIFEPLSSATKNTYPTKEIAEENNRRTLEMIERARDAMKKYASIKIDRAQEIEELSKLLMMSPVETSINHSNSNKENELTKLEKFIDTLETENNKVQLKSLAIDLTEHFSKPEDIWEELSANEIDTSDLPQLANALKY